MKSIARTAAVAACLVALAVAPPAALAQDAEVATGRVLAAEKVRYDAMVAGDFVALAELLADDLVYTHLHGGVEDEAAFLAGLRSGALRYRKIETSEVKVRLYGDAAVVTGRGEFHVTVDGREGTAPIRFTAVYARNAEGRWQLTTWQSTRRMEPPAG